MAMEVERGHRWFAALWNTISAPGERRFGRAIRKQLLGGLRGDVLETGAGTGHSFSYYQREAQVIATEPDPHMLRRAWARLADLDLPNIELRQASAEALPFDDASFDHVVSTLVLCTAQDPDQALSEARRVLRPAGTLRFWEHIRNDDSRFWGKAQDLIEPVWGWFGAGCHPNRRTEQAIKDAGFRIESIEHAGAGFQPLIYGIARSS
jgi:ubiquinone/menaquinone biosynthesis C-methylase UbiE